MKKYALISLLLCLVLLLAPLSVSVNAEGEAGSSFENPIVIDSIPFESGDVVRTMPAEGIDEGVFYKYTANAAATLVVTCSSESAHVSTFKNAASSGEVENLVGQGGAAIAVVAGDVLVFNLWATLSGTYSFTVTEKEAEPGSTPDTATEIESLGGSYGTATLNVYNDYDQYYTWTPLRDGVVKLSYVSNTYNADYATLLYANDQPFFNDDLYMEVTANVPVMIRASLNGMYSDDGKVKIKIEEAEVVKLDSSYSGYYILGNKYIKLDYSGKKISVLDSAKTDNISGVYTCTISKYGFMKSDVISLVAVNGENGVELLFNGRADSPLSVWEEPAVTDQEILVYLTGTYELYHPTTGQLYKTYSFDYEKKTVTVTTASTGATTSATFELCPVDGTITISGDRSKYKIYLYDSGTFKKGDITMGNTTMTYVASHDYVEEVVAPTCTERGYTKYTCSKCGDSYIDEDSYVLPLDHDYEMTLVHPTCTEAGYTLHVCTRCNDRYQDEEVAALGHDWAPATCDTAKKCNTCGLSEGDALGHDWQDATCTAPKTCATCGATEGVEQGHDWQDATCTAPKTCATCGATEGVALSHDWNLATCTEPKTCKVCKATEGEALNHDWQDATCTTPKTCKRCDVTEGEPLGHDMQPATCTKPAACSRCDKTEGQPTEHNWDEGVVQKEATEDSDGEMLLTCQDCGEELIQVIPAKDHVHAYTATVTAPTCTEKGFTTHTCRCGESYKDTYVDALNHDWKAANCTTAKTCKRCGEVEGKALGHDWQDATCTAPKTCKVCGKTEGGMVNHDWQKATCTAPKTCKNCGKTEGGTLEHSWKDASCTEPKKCTVCGKTEGVALNHDWQNATCTAPKTCSRCGATDGATLEHNYDGVQVGNKITYTCTVCGHSYQEDAPTGALTVPGYLSGTIHGSQDFTWEATEDGYLIIENVSSSTGVYIAVTINGADALPTENGYAVQTGDEVVITVTTYSEITIQIPVKLDDGSTPDQPEDSPMEFDVTWAGSSWSGYEGSWTAPYAGTFSFVIDASNITYDNLYFAIVTADGWGTWYVLNEDFFLNADGKYAVTLTAEEGERLVLMAYEDTHSASGELHIVVVEGEVAKHEHTYDEGVVTEPTCTTAGKTTYTCTVCGETKVEKIEKLAHTEEAILGKEATCTETGLTDGIKCSVCGKVLTEQTEIALVEHTYGEWVTEKEATATEDGSKKRTCTACGAEQTEVIPATGEPATQPTEPETRPTQPETQPATQPNGNNGSDGGNGVIVIVIVAVILVVGGVAVFVVIKKKK